MVFAFRRKSALEIFKFSVYVTIPILTVWCIASPYNLKQLVEFQRYIVYPPEGPRPPLGSKEDVAKGKKELIADSKANLEIAKGAR